MRSQFCSSNRAQVKHAGVSLRILETPGKTRLTTSLRYPVPRRLCAQPRRISSFHGMTSVAMGLCSNHRPIYQWQEFVEDLGDYQKGGYHPVRIGDVYSEGRYRIIHKLGFGSYSTVWLARDLQSNRYVALKIIVAEASETSSESRILHHLRNTYDLNFAGYSYLSVLWDDFSIKGPNGQHQCLVSKPTRRSIACLKRVNKNWLIPIEIARAIVAQAILGLQSIHRSGIIHGGKPCLETP